MTEENKEQKDAALAKIAAQFDRQLATLNAPDVHERIDALLESRGRVLRRSKAGPSF